MNKENTYEYKFGNIEIPKELQYDDRTMHYYENHSDEPPRELILKLGKKITDRILYKIPWMPKVGETMTKDDPEYWGLAAMVSDEMAEVALKMKVHKGMTMPEIAKATGKSEAYLEPLLQEMANIGLIEYNWENPTQTKQYVLPMFVPRQRRIFQYEMG